MPPTINVLVREELDVDPLQVPETRIHEVVKFLPVAAMQDPGRGVGLPYRHGRMANVAAHDISVEDLLAFGVDLAAGAQDADVELLDGLCFVV